MVPLSVQLVVNVCVFVPERGRERGYNAAISFWQNCLWGDASDPPTSGNQSRSCKESGISPQNNTGYR